MMTIHPAILVVLSPAILCAALCVAVNVGPARAYLARSMAEVLLTKLGQPKQVDTAISLFCNAAFIGTASGAVFGFSEGQPAAYVCAAVNALLCLSVVFRLTRLAVDLDQLQAEEAHRLSLQGIQSLARLELAAQAKRRIGSARLSRKLDLKRRVPPAKLRRNR